jgi:simple sugar transport system permease protein
VNAFDIIFWQVVLGGAVRLATPIALAALGETIAERTGTINLGIDGIMAAGAFAAVVGASSFGWGAGLLAGGLVGMIFGLGMAFAVVRGRANQIVVGIAISLLGAGLTTYFFQLWQPSGQSAFLVPLIPTVAVPFLRDLPLVGEALFGQSLLTYLCAALIVLATYGLKHTRPGLILRAVGDDPAGAAMRGIDVLQVKTLGLAIGGALAGIGGAALTIGYLGSFTDGVVAGRGYVAIAVVIIGRWSPVGAAAGALLFALLDSFALRVQTGDGFLPVEAYTALPYVVTLLVLVLTARSRVAPRALGAPIPA